MSPAAIERFLDHLAVESKVAGQHPEPGVERAGVPVQGGAGPTLGQAAVRPGETRQDVGASGHWVAVGRHVTDDPGRGFGTMTNDRSAMADRRLACGVEGWRWNPPAVYGIPVYEVLEPRGLEV